MKEKTIVSSLTLAASLMSYFYARQYAKDAVPYVMVGGFIGAVLGEAIVAAIEKRNKQEEPPAKKELEKNNEEQSKK